MAELPAAGACMVIGGWVAFTFHFETPNILKFEVMARNCCSAMFYLLPAVKLKLLQWLQVYRFAWAVFLITFVDIGRWKFVPNYSSYLMEF